MAGALTCGLEGARQKAGAVAEDREEAALVDLKPTLQNLPRQEKERERKRERERERETVVRREEQV